MRPKALANVVTLAVLASVTVLGVSADNDVVVPKKFSDLGARVNEYYRLEQEKKWGQTWEFRVPLYRGSVPKDTYIRDMEKDAHGWQLKSFRILKISEDGPCVLLSLAFIEIPPKGYYRAQGLPDISELSVTDDSRWERIDGVWQAWETGSRAHMTLNSAIVAPNQSLQGSSATCGGRPPELKR